MKTLIGKFFFISFLISVKLSSQEFYVNTNDIGVPSSQIFKFNISNPSEDSEAICPPPTYNNEAYTDIAISSTNHLFYVASNGALHKKDMSTSNCEFVGTFNTFINSLVADSGNYIYAIGQNKTLFRFDINSGIITNMGNIPNAYYPAGDLFFYENKLFLTIGDGILEINMINPSQSCHFATLNIISAYSAFSINYGTYSKAYILSANPIPLDPTNPIPSGFFLYELDMITKQLSNPIRIYNHRINGAATYYNVTSTNSICSLNPLSTQENIKDELYFDVVNPAKNNIICKTNIDRQEITQIRLYDNSARLIKDFSTQNNLERLDISNISDGIYLLTVATKKGETRTKKIIIKS
ncbi:hypothetical protein ASG22_03250 [Chryseobacterium sp. Leaf405]|uniref:T9SS type A sorting domain-containing protein n=1 Tax=Chryseobacterium sp. Leaf405 TaxID=1736367 RepID=UPI0006FB29B5|nr:T9SS type A sorting domain-containing protein [Chryseobacterium sp. Leaf405]KQT25740.1 hypothetical protein ASG22_03250 [Chryseobacterium sp. Leaf405]